MLRIHFNAVSTKRFSEMDFFFFIPLFYFIFVFIRQFAFCFQRFWSNIFSIMMSPHSPAETKGWASIFVYKWHFAFRIFSWQKSFRPKKPNEQKHWFWKTAKCHSNYRWIKDKTLHCRYEYKFFSHSEQWEIKWINVETKTLWQK